MRIRRLLGLALVPLLLAPAAPVSALVATYEWVHSSQTRTATLPATTPVGTLTFDHAGIADPMNFTAVPMSALVDVSFTFNSIGVTATLADIASTIFESPSTSTLFSAANGFLTTDFNLSKLTTSPIFNLSLNGEVYNPGGATSVAFLQFGTPQGTLFESNVGDWQLAASPVPLPAAWLLMLPGLLGIGWLGRRR